MTQFSKKGWANFFSKIVKRRDFGPPPPPKKNTHFRRSCRPLVKDCMPNIGLGWQNFQKKSGSNFLLRLLKRAVLDPPRPSPPQKKSCNLFKFVLVLLSASYERVGVSRMRDFSSQIWFVPPKKHWTICFLKSPPNLPPTSHILIFFSSFFFF